MDKEERDFRDVQKGKVYENEGNNEKAIEIYEKLIARKFEGSHPYDRLCILYRKQGNLVAEEKVLKKAISMFIKVTESGRPDGPPKLERYQKRLEIVHKKMLK